MDDTKPIDERTEPSDEQQRIPTSDEHAQHKADSLARSLFWMILICGIAVDRAVKWFEIAGMTLGQSIEAIPGILNLTYVRNRGVGFGMLEGVIWVPILVSVLVCAAILFAYLRVRPLPKLVAIALGLLGAGAIGNLIDRLFFGHVVDLFELAFIRYPVFNVADIMVTIGSILLVFWLLFKSPDKRESD